MKFEITIPETMGDLTVKTLLEEQWLVPRKIRHFLRTKKHLRVNGDQIHWNSEVHPGDLVTVEFDETDYPQKNIVMGEAKYVECLYEDEHLIVVNKPEGMKTHGNEPTEVALLNHVSAYVGETCYVVHRLDKETSGAVMFAKNPFVLPILNRLLEEKQISRDYWALAEGKFQQKTVTYRDKIGRDRHDRRKRVVDRRHGQTAVTIVTRLKVFPNSTLVNCQLKTGRTHQIRVHLSHHGHAILGDPLYSQQKAPSLMLHAHRLSFIHPFSQEKVIIKAHSKSFEQFLKQ